MTSPEPPVCGGAIPGPDDGWLPCPKRSLFVVEREGAGPGEQPKDTCAEHLAVSVMGLLDDYHARVVVGIRWDSPRPVNIAPDTLRDIVDANARRLSEPSDPEELS